MQKIKLGLCEKIELNHIFEIELPKGVDEDEVFNEIDRADHRDSVYYIVNQYGGKVLSFVEDGSGDVGLEVEWAE